MAKGVPHYFRDGSRHTGGSHKMPDGSVHSGKTHSSSSKKLYHLDELPKSVKEKAMRGMKSVKAKSKAPKPKKRPTKSMAKKKPTRGYSGY